MSDEQWTQQQRWDRAARLLTEGERSKNVVRRMAIATQVQAIFDLNGYPDWWSRLTRLEDDTAHMERTQGSW